MVDNNYSWNHNFPENFDKNNTIIIQPVYGYRVNRLKEADKKGNVYLRLLYILHCDI
jgi:hypothetical protein